MPQVSLEALTTQVRAGNAVASFPTDTVPALAVHPDCAALIFAAKQRSHEKPLILMGASADDLWPYVHGTADERALWKLLVEDHWPGPLTLVLPTSDRCPPAINPLDPTTVGIRVPNCAIARQILSKTGVLATTSANRSGEPPLRSMTTIRDAFPDALTLRDDVLDRAAADDGPTGGSGLPSTVVRWTNHRWDVLRQGAISLG